MQGEGQTADVHEELGWQPLLCPSVLRLCAAGVMQAWVVAQQRRIACGGATLQHLQRCERVPIAGYDNGVLGRAVGLVLGGGGGDTV